MGKVSEKQGKSLSLNAHKKSARHLNAWPNKKISAFE